MLALKALFPLSASSVNEQTHTHIEQTKNRTHTHPAFSNVQQSTKRNKQDRKRELFGHQMRRKIEWAQERYLKLKKWEAVVNGVKAVGECFVKNVRAKEKKSGNDKGREWENKFVPKSPQFRRKKLGGKWGWGPHYFPSPFSFLSHFLS